MKKIIRLTESDLTRIVRRVISEQGTTSKRSIIDKIIDKWITFDLGPKGYKLSPHVCKAGIENSSGCLNYVKGDEYEQLDDFFEKNGIKKYTDTWSDEDFVNATNTYNNLERTKGWKFYD